MEKEVKFKVKIYGSKKKIYNHVILWLKLNGVVYHHQLPAYMALSQNIKTNASDKTWQS